MTRTSPTDRNPGGGQPQLNQLWSCPLTGRQWNYYSAKKSVAVELQVGRMTLKGGHHYLLEQAADILWKYMGDPTKKAPSMKPY